MGLPFQWNIVIWSFRRSSWNVTEVTAFEGAVHQRVKWLQELESHIVLLFLQCLKLEIIIVVAEGLEFMLNISKNEEKKRKTSQNWELGCKLLIFV